MTESPKSISDRRRGELTRKPIASVYRFINRAGMELRKISPEESEQINEACRTADHIFLYSVDRVAAMMGLEIDEVDEDKSMGDIAKKHPELVAGSCTHCLQYIARAILRTR